MFRVKSHNQIRNSSTVKGFRSLHHCTGAPMGTLDKARRNYGEAKRRWAGEVACWKAGQKLDYLVRTCIGVGGLTGGPRPQRGHTGGPSKK